MSKDVENQYTNWVYPLPIDDMRMAVAGGSYWEIGDPFLYWPMMWPRKRGVEKLDVLVAGCGTNQAAYYACRNPNWNVIGVDLSEPSLAHQNYLKEKHALNNLTLVKMNLLEIESLKKSFDFITSTGVLHHLPEPDAGLKVLSNVLRPEGVINLMVYGKSLRLGVYLLQEVFRLIGLQQTPEDVALVRTTVDSLAPDHVVKRYTKNATDLQYDAGMVDTFLHPQDQAYFAKDVFSFTRRAGLEFLSWCDPIEYSLEAAIPPQHPLWSKLKNLDDETAAQVSDLLVQLRGTHRWLCAHPDFVRRNKVSFDGEDMLDYSIVAHRDFKIIEPSDLTNKTSAKCMRQHEKFELDYRLAAVLARLNMSNTIRQVIKTFNLSQEEERNALELCREGFKALHKRGHIYVLLPSA